MNEPAPAGAPRQARRILLRTLRIGGDVLLYAAGFVVSAAAVHNVPGSIRIDGDAVQLTNTGGALFLLSLLAWVSVFLRRRTPWIPLIAGVILAVIGSDYLLLLVGACSAVLVWPRRWCRRVVLAAVGLVVAFVVRELLSAWGDDGIIAAATRDLAKGGSSEVASAVATAFVAGVSLLVAFGSAILVRTRRESRAHLERAKHEQDRAAALSTELGRQSERERLARDIHDALAHRLSVISLQSGALEESARATDERTARAALTLRQQAHASLDDLRGLLSELRNEAGEQGDETAVPPSMASMRAVGHLIRSVREGGAAVDAFVLVEDAERAGAALDRTTYRIVQEGLTNALKHAPGCPIAVYVEASVSSGVRVRVSNPVLPGAVRAAPGAGRGIIGITERAQLLGGTAWAGVSDGQFIVDVTLPWSDRGGERGLETVSHREPR